MCRSSPQPNRNRSSNAIRRALVVAAAALSLMLQRPARAQCDPNLLGQVAVVQPFFVPALAVTDSQ